MSEPVASTTSSLNDSVPAPWWVHLCRWLWKISAFLGVSVVLSLAVSVLSFWLTSPGGVIPAKSPAARLVAWLVAEWPVMLLVGCCFLLLALLIGVVSRGPAQATAPLAPAQQNRVRMLRRLRRSYSDVLAQSLQGATWMELGLAHQPAAVQNATTLLLHLAHRPEQLLPPGTSLTQVYEEAAHELLILGEPGAGKSTLLLQLAQQLVARAEQDDTQPLPVLLPLSPWAVTRPPLQDWLAEQVAQLYDIPEQLARHWVQEEQLLPLLDGLDEMEEVARPACIVAINAYHHAHPGPLVVCSRKAEYEEAARHHRLTLQSAVVVQPLSLEQVDAYLTQAGKPLEALHRTLNKNPALQELAGTPLMLSVLMLTYQGTPVRSLSQRGTELLQQVWSDYVRRMVERKGDAARYPLERTRSWLHWQAQQMRKHNQTVFYLEHLQPDWLPAGQELSYTWLAIRIPGILIGALAGLTITLLLGYGGLGLLLQFGVLGGFLGGLFSEATGGERGFQRAQSHPRSAPRRVIIERTVTSALIGLVYGLSFGLYLGSYYGPGDWLRRGSISGVGIGLSCWLLLSLVPRFSSREVQASATNTARRWPGLRRVMRAWYGQRALLVAAVLGVGSGLSIGLGDALGFRPGLVLSDVLDFSLFSGLLCGIISVLVSLILEVQKEDVHLTERLRWTWTSLIRSLFASRHLRTTVVIASIVLILVGLGSGTFVVFYKPPYGWQSGGLIYGLGRGLIEGLSAGLSFWLLLGLFQGISHERVEDQDRRVFNQGIRRSFRNSRIMGIISGAVIGATGVLSGALSAGLNEWDLLTFSNHVPIIELNVDLGRGLRAALFSVPYIALSTGLLLVVSGGLLVWASYGGLAVLRHAVLRLLLWRTHTFPWRAAPLLEDATARILLRRVGGGYSFTHRLLLDYLADLNVGTLSALPAAQRTKSPPL